MFQIGQDKKIIANMAAAYKSGDEKEIAKAWDAYNQDLQNNLKKENEKLLNSIDLKVLSERGCRVLTQKENRWYQKLIDAAKSSNPKQSFDELISIEGMPETIIEDVYRTLKMEHPLLKRVKFTDVKFLTKWVLSSGKKSRAIWGEINTTIKQQLESSFKALEIIQNKLTAYIILSKDMLNLGPVWLDNYVRTILKESIALGLEYGIIYGSGIKGEPIGLVRNIEKGVQINSETGYAKKDKIKVTDFSPLSYGKLIADNIIEDEDGNTKIIPIVSLIVNPIDYLTKIMPATTVMSTQGTYARDLFPYPTEVIQSVMVDKSEAILADLDNYFLGLGYSKNAVIEYSDEVNFLEDQRVYKGKLYADGRPLDNNVSALLDISELDPAYITVVNKPIQEDAPVIPETTEEEIDQG